MKKIMLLLGSILLGLSASAQLYVTGEAVTGAPENWNPGNPLVVNQQDGGYTFKAKGNFKISTEKGDWNSFNSNAKSLDGAWNRATSTATAKLKSSDGDIMAPKADLEITYFVNEALTDIKATLPEGETFGEITLPDFYVIGEAFGGWNLKDSKLKMTRSGNVYTYVAEKGISGPWKINDGTWAQSYGQGEAGMPVANTEYNLAFNGGNLNTSISEKATITFTYTEGGPYKLLISTEGGENPPTPPTPGDFTGWYFNIGSADITDYWSGVAVSADGTASAEELPIGTNEFKVKVWNGTKDAYYTTASKTIEPGVATVLTTSTENDCPMTISGAAAGDSYSFAFDCNTNTLTVTKVGGENPPTPPTPGDFTGWYLNIGSADITDYWSGSAVNEDGTASTEGLPIGTNEFKVKVWNGTKDAYYTTTSKTIEPGVATALTTSTENDCPMTISGAAAGDSYSFAFDCNTNTLTVTKVGGENPPTPPVVEMPAKLYLIGNIENCQYGMNPTIGVEMTREGNEFKGESVILDAYEGYGWFSFCQALGESGMEESEAWGIVNSYDRFGPATETTVMPNEQFDFETFKEGVNASACGSYKIEANAPGKTYIFLMNFETKKLTVTVGSGVDIIDGETEGKPVYFNLQGQRVENPSNGVFVRVVNDKATKVMK